jgi:hypothetical protein
MIGSENGFHFFGIMPVARIPAIDRIFEQFVKLSAFFVASPLMVREKASAADLKFLHHLPHLRSGTSNRKAALES